MAKKVKTQAINPTDERNPNASRFWPRKLQLHIYGLVSVLVLTIALIVILEYINRSLPDGSKSQYSPQLRVREAPEPDELPALAARDSPTTITDFFIPMSMTLTVAMAQCTAPPLTCACPQDEITDCSCSPDPSATVCMCTVKANPSCGCDPTVDMDCSCPNSFYRECVCPPDSKCSTCRCPGGGSYYEPCECPPDPYAAGCNSVPRLPTCSEYSSEECGCSVVQEWTCGRGVARTDCAVPTSAIGGVSSSVVVIYPTFSTVTASEAPSFTPSSETLIASLPPAIFSTSTTGKALSSFTPTSEPVTLSPPPSILSTKTTSETSSSSFTPISEPATISPPPAIFSTATTSGILSSASASSSELVIISPPPGFGNPSRPVSTPATISLPTPLSLGPSTTPVTSANPQVGTSNLSPPSTLVATSSPITSSSSALAIVAPGAATVTGSSSTLASSALIPGVIVLISFTLVPATSGPAPSRVAAVTFLRTTPPPSASLITGPSGSIYTIPPILLATSPALTMPNQVSPFSSGPATSATLTAPLAPVTSPTSPNPTISGLGASVLTPNLPTPAPALYGTTAVSGGGGVGSGGAQSTSVSSPIPSIGSSAVAVTVYSWPVSKTVFGGYIPIILARLFHGGWTAIYSHLNRHEAVDQLVGHNPVSSAVLFGTGFALWHVWPAYVAVWCLSPFASEVVYFDTNYGCANPDLNNPANPCWPPIMSVNVWVVRVLQTLLALVALTIVVLVGLWFKKPSKSSGDPTSIAAVAAIMGHPEVERDFQAFDAEISTKELKEQLKNKKYQLSNYQTDANTERYGIVPVPLEAGEAQNTNLVKSRSALSRLMNFDFLANWKILQMRCDIVFMLYLLGVVAATILYLSNINNITIIHLFDGSTVGRRLLFAVLACFASSYWAKLQRDAQTLAPYAQLAYPSMAPPQPTILLRKRALPIIALFPLLRHQHFTAALTALTAVFSEFLVVTLSGLPYRPGQLRSEFLFCGIASLAVLSFMLIMLVILNLWRALAVPHLPRKPDTIAAVMTYVCNSSMNKDFEGLETLDLKERDSRIRELRKWYRYGLRRDADGKERWAVDEVTKTEDTES